MSTIRHRHGRARPGHPRLAFGQWSRKEDVDARVKPGHDDLLF
jgi:hypothetical protein